MADLISMNESPFVPDDEDALKMMSDTTLRQLRNLYAAPRVATHRLQHHSIDDADPALAAMTPPSSLNVYRESLSLKPVADPVLEARRRAWRNNAAVEKGTLPNVTGLYMHNAVDVDDSDPAVAAMTAHTLRAAVRVFSQERRR